MQPSNLARKKLGYKVISQKSMLDYAGISLLAAEKRATCRISACRICACRAAPDFPL